MSLFCIAIILFLLDYSAGAKNESSIHPMLLPGKCRGLWRPDNLVGRCFGLRPYKKFDELKGLKVNSADDCRSVCCNLGDKCVSWQYLESKKECKLGGIVRLGLEKTGTPDWCDPNPPIKWNGNRLHERSATGQCTWQEKVQENQCFGLGDPRLNSTRGALNTVECAQACCAHPQCEIWQEHPLRGCFFGRSTQCPNSLEAFQGKRKCIPNYCGGMEEEIFSKFKKKTNLAKFQ